MIIIYVIKQADQVNSEFDYSYLTDLNKITMENLSETDRQQSQVLININLKHSGNQTKAY